MTKQLKRKKFSLFITNKKNVRFIIFLICTSTIAILETNNVTHISEKLQNILLWQKIILQNSVQSIKNIRQIFYIKQENIQLKQKIKNLEQKLLQIEYITQEINKLKTDIGQITDKSVAKVLGFENNIYNSQMIISSNNLHEMSPVITKDGLVGIIVNKNNKIATVTMLLDTRFFVTVCNESGNSIIIKGNKTNMISIITNSNINNLTKQFKVGDILKTTGECGFFAKGIPVAKITKITNNTIIAQPIVNIQNVNYVLTIDIK